MDQSNKELSNVLVVIDYNKEYLLKYFIRLKSKLNLYFINYSYQSEIRDEHKEYGQAIFWKDFKNAFHLIKSIKPKVVVFFELETLNQIALNVACKELGIKTIFSDHGLQDLKISFQANRFVKKNNNRKNRIKQKVKLFAKNSIHSIINNRLFFEKTLKSSIHSDFLGLYKKVRLKNTILDTQLKLDSNLRLPDKYICFTPRNYAYHQATGHDKNIPVVFTGVPELDEFRVEHSNQIERNFILFIDQPYVHFNYYGWNKEHKYSFLNDLKEAALSAGKLFLIKKHPREISFWNDFDHAFDFISGIDLIKKISSISHVLGYNSTMLLPFAASKDIIVYNLRNHPDTNSYTPTDLVDYGVAIWYDQIDHGVRFKENRQRIEEMNNAKQYFIKDYLYLLDGKAGDRFDKAILDECN